VINRIDLIHFKCFEVLKLPLAPLTLLSGTNASGKSSSLQALALIHQTLREQEWSDRLLLNGKAIELGTLNDIVDKVTGRQSFGIGVTFFDQAYQWIFQDENRSAMSARLESLTINGVEYRDREKWHYLLPADSNEINEILARQLRTLHYLTAERIGPQEIYPLADPSAGLVVGSRGENAVSILHWLRDRDVLLPMRIPDVPPTLLHQAGAWMNYFFPDSSFDIQSIPKTSLATLGFRTSDATDFHRPIHVGFGLTQILPIIVAALATENGGLLIIENPEVHLHPAGQARMGEFLAKVAASGIQVLIETHSDHILNGIRRAVKAAIIASELVALHFFQNRFRSKSQVVSPTLDVTGNIDVWPEGFFDQYDRDMNYFAGWGE
jgi:predicted ATPase